MIRPNRISPSLILLNPGKTAVKVVNVQEVASETTKGISMFWKTTFEDVTTHEKFLQLCLCSARFAWAEAALAAALSYLHFHMLCAPVAFLAASSQLVLHPTASAHTERAVPGLRSEQRARTAVRRLREKRHCPGRSRQHRRGVWGRHAGRRERNGQGKSKEITQPAETQLS